MAHLPKGIYNSKIYYSWSNMKRRCNNKNDKDYGGRGISYDKKWEDFMGFYEDMFSTYKNGLTLDRIDNNGNYCKSNCRWATRKQQNRNTRKNRRFNYLGQKKLLSEWSEITGIPRSTLAQRIYVYGWQVEDALSRKLLKNSKSLRKVKQ